MRQPFTFGSLSSGIEAASEAFLPLAWRCAYVAEIDPWCCAYLAQRHGAGRPLRMPRPEDVVFPDGFDPGDKELFAHLAKRVRDELSPAEADFVASWRTRAQRRAAIRALDRIEWGDRLTNFGDIAQIQPAELPPVDLLAAGWPCQDFSIAGLRRSLEGARGNISIIGARLLIEAAELGLVRGALLEQVPDILNTEDNAWGNLLGAIVGADAALEGLEHGGKWPRAGMAAEPRARVAWRILDAQHFRLAQRRERVWAVVDFGDGPDPAAVLFERKGLPGDHAAGRQASEDLAPTLAGGARQRGGYSYDDVPCVADGPQRRAAYGGNNTSGPIDVATARTASHTASGRQDFETETFVVEAPEVAHPLLAKHNASHRDDADTLIAHSLRGEGFDASVDGTGRGTPIVPVAFNLYPAGPYAATHAIEADVSYALTAKGEAAKNGNGLHIVQDAIAFSLRGREGGAMPEVEEGSVSPALRAAEGGSTRPFVAIENGGEFGGMRETATSAPLRASGDDVGAGGEVLLAAPRMAVRRITVVEAERLQGFRDNATLIDWPSSHRSPDDLAETVAYLVGHGLTAEEAAALAETPDGPRYKALGNSWPVPVARWIGERIAAVEANRA